MHPRACSFHPGSQRALSLRSSPSHPSTQTHVRPLPSLHTLFLLQIPFIFCLCCLCPLFSTTRAAWFMAISKQRRPLLLLPTYTIFQSAFKVSPLLDLVAILADPLKISSLLLPTVFLYPLQPFFMPLQAKPDCSLPLSTHRLWPIPSYFSHSFLMLPLLSRASALQP